VKRLNAKCGQPDRRGKARIGPVTAAASLRVRASDCIERPRAWDFDGRLVMKRSSALGVVVVCLLAALAPFARAAAVESVRSLAQREKAPLLKTLEEIVNIETGSRDVEGLDRLANLIAARLAAAGGKVEFVAPGPDVYRMADTPEKIGKMVRATFTGTGARSILLIAHMDTVYPRGTLAKQPFRIDGDRAYGLGISDDKQGVAVILHVMAMLEALKFRDHGRITVLINGDEELSSPASRGLLTQLGSEHDAVFSFEATRTDSDNLALATSGIAAVNLRVQGRGSHSGGAPERGVNALYELAHLILQTRDLSEPELGLKMNWTLAQAGVTRNMIPPEATASADVRVLRVADYDRIEKKIRERIANQLLPETKVELVFERRRPPLEATPASRKLAAHAQAVYREIGRELVVEARPGGGGTDAAFAGLKARGPVIERFGLQGFGAHSTSDEYVLISSIEARLYLATRLIMDVAQGKNP
jgi:glutamate carboxypeptidase